MNLGEFIKKYRIDNKISMDLLAQKSGLSKSYISMLENDFNPSNTNKSISPSIVTLKKLSMGMNIDFHELLNILDDDILLNDTDEEIVTKSHNTRIVLGKNIKKLRVINRMTQVDLAKKLGVAQNAISNWEKGLREPDNLNILIQLSQIFNISLDELLSDSSDSLIQFSSPNPELINEAERIKLLRLQKGWTQEQLGQKLGVQKAAIAKYESGRVENLKRDTIEKMSLLFDVSPAYLLGIDNNANSHIRVPLPNPELMRTVPIYGNISCGTGMFVEDDIIDYVTVPVSMLRDKNKEVFGMFADGDSMVNAGINTGDLIIFEKTTAIENGQIGCFCVDDNVATCKKFYKNDNDNIITLTPANDKYAPITITVENMGFHVVGKLVLKLGRFD